MQTAKRAARGRERDALVEVPLPLDFLATDPVRFIPVQFRETDGAVLQPNARDALHLAPTALAIQPSKPDVFRSVRVGVHGAIEWDGDIDLCPDALYMRLTGKSPEELLPARS